MKRILCLLCLLCGCGQIPDEQLSEKSAEMNYIAGVNDGMKLADDIRVRFVKNEAEATALMNQRKTNWLATRPRRLTR